MSRVFLHRAVAVIMIVAAFVAGGLLLGAVTDMLLLFFAGVLLAIMLRGLARALVSIAPIAMPVALALVGVAIVGTLVGAGWFVGPKMAG